MALWARQGTCNRCGQCCGADGRGAPFPSNYPEAIRHRSLDDVVAAIPQLGLCGLQNLGGTGDLIGVPEEARAGTVRIQGRKFPYVWVKDVGLVKDTSPQNNGSSWLPECPFLDYAKIGNPDGFTHACGLVGTNEEGAYNRFCRTDPYPVLDDRNKSEWQTRFPACSYTWTEIPE